MPCGKSARIWVTALRTSLTARSVSVPRRNSAVVTEMPSEISEVMWRTPAIPATAVSTCRVTEFSISSGDAPARLTETVTIGKLTFGVAFTGSRRKEKMPITVSSRNRTMVGIGRRIAQEDSCMVIFLFLQPL